MNSLSLYHVILRTSSLIVALVLVFVSGLVSPVTKQLSDQAQSYLANAIGMTAMVEPTELNLQTAQLTQREQELNAREAALAAREIDARAGVGALPSSDTATYVLSFVLFVLLTLIILNFVMDFIRARDERIVQA